MLDFISSRNWIRRVSSSTFAASLVVLHAAFSSARSEATSSSDLSGLNVFSLRPSDILVTGTPAGVGFKRKPAGFLRDGVVETSTESIDSLRNSTRVTRRLHWSPAAHHPNETLTSSPTHKPKWSYRHVRHLPSDSSQAS
ncbi:fumarylacetoacetate hydrolase family protein [Arthrobacter sp. NPDC089319]|uniref:fumarylacetoacetate hydrolase family protein n=1 Tax=Arthrobacter sp. NPDC089319 TaxID=3155915 RepID=UPI003411F8C4